MNSVLVGPYCGVTVSSSSLEVYSDSTQHSSAMSRDVTRQNFFFLLALWWLKKKKKKRRSKDSNM
jgi:hypothetical protein